MTYKHKTDDRYIDEEIDNKLWQKRNRFMTQEKVFRGEKYDKLMMVMTDNR